MTNIHPKTSGTAVGTSLGVLLVTVLGTIHGVHLTSATDAAITGFLSLIGSYLAPTNSLTASNSSSSGVDPSAPVR